MNQKKKELVKIMNGMLKRLNQKKLNKKKSKKIMTSKKLMKNQPNMDIKKKNNKYIYIKYKQITNLINKLNNFVFQFFNIIKIMFHDLK